MECSVYARIDENPDQGIIDAVYKISSDWGMRFTSEQIKTIAGGISVLDSMPKHETIDEKVLLFSAIHTCHEKDILLSLSFMQKAWVNGIDYMRAFWVNGFDY